MLYRGLELEKVGGVTIDLAKLCPSSLWAQCKLDSHSYRRCALDPNWLKSWPKLVCKTCPRDAVDAIRRERTKLIVDQVRSLEQFQLKFRHVDSLVHHPNRLVVFVDDLDRCLPEKAIEVLEAIKLFLDARRCIFILGLDHNVIDRGVEIRYKDFVKEGERHENQCH